MNQSSDNNFVAELQKNTRVNELAVVVKVFGKGKSTRLTGKVIAVSEKSLSLRLSHPLREGQHIGLRINITDRLYDAFGIGAGAEAETMVVKAMGEVINEEEGKSISAENIYTIRLIGQFSIDQE